MEPTRLRLLVALGVLAAALGWAATHLVDTFANRTLAVPWTMAVVMAMLAFALVLWARGTRARLAGRPGTRPIEPLVAARTAALALAASRTGALVAGFYAGVVVALLPDWSIDPVRTRVITALVTIVAALLVVAAALWLERICRLPPDDPRDASDDDSL